MKILLVTPSEGILGYISDWSRNALVSLGCNVKRFDYRKIQYPIIGSLRARIKIINNLEIKKMNLSLLKEIESYKPDVVLVFFGERILEKTLDIIKNEYKIILVNWFHDTIVSPYRTNFLKNYPSYYDYFFIIDSLKALEKININCKKVITLPLACDESVHKRMKLSIEEINKYKSDVSFIGVINHNRRKILEYICSGINIGIWAPKVSIYGNFLKESPKIAKYYKGGPLPYIEVLKIINASKIILNIHGFSGESHFDLPLRLFDTAGCGTFQLVEYSDTLEKYFEIGKEIICYSNKEELKELIEYYLTHDDERETIAKNAQKRVYKEHTYKHRMQELLNIIKKK